MKLRTSPTIGLCWQVKPAPVRCRNEMEAGFVPPRGKSETRRPAHHADTPAAVHGGLRSTNAGPFGMAPGSSSKPFE